MLAHAMYSMHCLVSDVQVAAKFLQDMSGYFIPDSDLEAFRRSLEDGRILCDVVDLIKVQHG